MCCKHRGFTLVELLIALFIFSLLSAFAYQAINQLIVSQHSLENEDSILTGIQKTLLFLERDVRQSMEWTSNNEQSSLSLLLEESTGFGLHTTGGKVHYALRDKILYRDNYDEEAFGTVRQELVSTVLLSDIEAFAVNLLPETDVDQGLFLGIEVLIRHNSLQEIRRVIFAETGLPDAKFDVLKLSGVLVETVKTDAAEGSVTEVELPANY